MLRTIDETNKDELEIAQQASEISKAYLALETAKGKNKDKELNITNFLFDNFKKAFEANATYPTELHNQICEINGWTFKQHDIVKNTMVICEGVKSPQTFQTASSLIKKAFGMNNLGFNGLVTYADVRTITRAPQKSDLEQAIAKLAKLKDPIDYVELKAKVEKAKKNAK